MAFIPGKPKFKGDWGPSGYLADDESPAPDSQLTMRKGYKGRPGPHYEAAETDYRPFVRHFEREIGRWYDKGAKPMYPPGLTKELEKADPDSKHVFEQTPFGRVTANPGRKNDLNFMSTGRVSYIETLNEDYEDKAGFGTTYRVLAKRLSPEMAHAVLAQVYETLEQRMNGEDDNKRQDRCAALQAGQARWNAEQRRTMAIVYALTILSEDQRSAGGKVMRSALRLVADERMTAEQAFDKNRLEGPAVIQTASEKAKNKKLGNRPLGGLESLRAGYRGAFKQSNNERMVMGEMTDSSDDETVGERQARYARQKKIPPQDKTEMELGAERRRHRQDGERTGKDSGYSKVAAKKRADRDGTSAPQSRKRKGAEAGLPEGPSKAKRRQMTRKRKREAEVEAEVEQSGVVTRSAAAKRQRLMTGNEPLI
jgi:hypothetical protein